jgi:hypothetical protein
MGSKQVEKYDFENEYPVSKDISPEKVRFDKLSNGYKVSYSDEKRFERDGVTGMASKSFHFSQTFGHKLEEANMEVTDGMIKIRGRFGSKEGEGK